MDPELDELEQMNQNIQTISQEEKEQKKMDNTREGIPMDGETENIAEFNQPGKQIQRDGNNVEETEDERNAPKVKQMITKEIFCTK